MRGKHHICLMNGVSLLSYERDVRIICKNKRYMYMVEQCDNKMGKDMKNEFLSIRLELHFFQVHAPMIMDLPPYHYAKWRI